jgi:hypothetical protein
MKKSQPSDVEKLEAPVRLTPEQLEIVAAGFMAQVKTTDVIKDMGKLVLTGAHPVPPVIKQF